MSLAAELHSRSLPLTVLRGTFLSVLSLRGAVEDCGIWLARGSVSPFQGRDTVWPAQFTWEEKCFSQCGMRGSFHRTKAGRKPSTSCPFAPHNSTYLHPPQDQGRREDAGTLCRLLQEEMIEMHF